MTRLDWVILAIISLSMLAGGLIIGYRLGDRHVICIINDGGHSKEDGHA